MLIAEKEGARVEAAEAIKGSQFHCPGCQTAVVLKQGRIRIPHFAHKSEAVCAFATGETLAHLSAKAAFKAAWSDRGVRAEIEYPLNGLTGDRRADVLVWSPQGKRCAIELQHSSISLEEIEARTESYHRMDVAVIWVAFLDLKRFDDVTKLTNTAYLGSKFAAPIWQRWVHGFNFGHLWFYDVEAGVVWCGKFQSHEIEVPESSWYEDGEERSAGGYSRNSRRWKNVRLHGPYHLSEMRIEEKSRTRKTLGNYVFPGGRTAHLIPSSCKSIKDIT